MLSGEHAIKFAVQLLGCALSLGMIGDDPYNQPITHVTTMYVVTHHVATVENCRVSDMKVSSRLELAGEQLTNINVFA